MGIFEQPISDEHQRTVARLQELTRQVECDRGLSDETARELVQLDDEARRAAADLEEVLRLFDLVRRTEEIHSAIRFLRISGAQLIGKAESHLAGSRTEEENQLTRRIRQLQDEVRHTESDYPGSLLERYIRPDATEHFFSDPKLQESRDTVAKINAIESGLGPNQWLGERLREQRDRAQASLDKFEHEAELCKVGEKIAELKAEAAELTAQRDRLEEERRTAAVSS